jgi:hypothetical protein
LKGDLVNSSLWRVSVEGGEEPAIEAVCADNYAVVDQGIAIEPAACCPAFRIASGRGDSSLARHVSAYGFHAPDVGGCCTQYAGQGSDLMLVENFRSRVPAS